MRAVAGAAILATVLAGCMTAVPPVNLKNELLELRASEWHTCLGREFQSAVRHSTSRSVAAEIAFGLCTTEENAIVGSAGLSPDRTMQILTQAKATLKQRMIAAGQAATTTPPPPRPGGQEI